MDGVMVYFTIYFTESGDDLWNVWCQKTRISDHFWLTFWIVSIFDSLSIFVFGRFS